MRRLVLSTTFSILSLIVLSMTGYAEIKKTSSDADFNNPEGFFNLLNGNYDKAISIFSREINKNLLDANSYFYRGLAYHRKGQKELAVSDYTKAIEIDPNYTEAYFFRGTVYQDKGQHNRAVSDYTSTIRTDSRYAEAYKERGLIYFSKKEYNKALKDLIKAKELGLDVEIQIFEETKILKLRDEKILKVQVRLIRNESDCPKSGL